MSRRKDWLILIGAAALFLFVPRPARAQQPPIVGSEEARLHASLRPPLKLHVRFSRMQLSRRHMT